MLPDISLTSSLTIKIRLEIKLKIDLKFIKNMNFKRIQYGI